MDNEKIKKAFYFQNKVGKFSLRTIATSLKSSFPLFQIKVAALTSA